MKLRGLFVGLGLFLGVLIASALYADLERLTQVTLHYPLERIWPALALALGNYAVRTIRFRYYMGQLRVQLGWLESWLVFVSGFLFTISPGKMGEVYKAWLLKKRHDVAMTETTTAVIAERFTDTVGLLAIAAVGVAHHGAHIGLFITVVCLCVGFLGVVVHPSALPRLCDWLASGWLGRTRWAKPVATVRHMHGVMRILCTPRTLLIGIALAATAWLLECLAFRVLLDGVGAGGGHSEAIVVYAMATLFGAVSMLPGGVGSTEAVMVALCLQDTFRFDLVPAEATLVTLLIRLTTLWFAVGLACLCLLALRRLPATQRPSPDGA